MSMGLIKDITSVIGRVMEFLLDLRRYPDDKFVKILRELRKNQRLTPEDMHKIISEVIKSQRCEHYRVVRRKTILGNYEEAYIKDNHFVNY